MIGIVEDEDIGDDGGLRVAAALRLPKVVELLRHTHRS